MDCQTSPTTPLCEARVPLLAHLIWDLHWQGGVILARTYLARWWWSPSLWLDLHSPYCRWHVFVSLYPWGSTKEIGYFFESLWPSTVDAQSLEKQSYDFQLLEEGLIRFSFWFQRFGGWDYHDIHICWFNFYNLGSNWSRLSILGLTRCMDTFPFRETKLPTTFLGHLVQVGPHGLHH